MSLKVFKFSDKMDAGIYIFLYGFIPTNIFGRLFLNYFQDVNGFLVSSLAFFMIFHFILLYIFSPMYVATIEVRNKDIRFFKPFSNKWAPIDHYRFIANGVDLKKIVVYKKNCKKTGTIVLKGADPKKKKEFLDIIEPYLTVRGDIEPNLDSKRNEGNS